MLMKAARPISTIPIKSKAMNGNIKANSTKLCPPSETLRHCGVAKRNRTNAVLKCCIVTYFIGLKCSICFAGHVA